MGANILLVESNELLRSGLKSIFANDPRVTHIYEATNARRSAELQVNTIDLIIINQALIEDMDTLYGKRFVIITNDPNMMALKTAFNYGAISYLTVNAPADL